MKIELEGGKEMVIESGSVTSNLKDSCPYCDEVDCYANCDGSQGDIDGLESEEEVEERRRYNFAIDGMESFILNLIEEIDIPSSKMKRVIESTLEAIENNI